MARGRTLASMIADIRQRTNQENSTFVTDAEITEYLNQELAEVHGRLVFVQGQPLIRSEYPIAVVAGVATYPLAADFLSAQEVMATINGFSGFLKPFMPAEHGYLSSPSAAIPYLPVMYRVQGNNIEFRPATQAFTATVYYTPSCLRLVNPSDVFDGYNGWEMAAIAGACASVMAKEESDPSFFLGLKSSWNSQIEKLAAHRDMSNPERVQETVGGNFEWAPPSAWWWL